MSIEQELNQIYQQHGSLTPELIVDVARDKKHPLHDRFEWDDRKAGEAWRREQASSMIRSVQVTWTTDDSCEKVRRYHHIPLPEGSGYRDISDIQGDEFQAKLVLAVAEREWKRLHSKYATLSEFLALVRADVA